MNRKIAALWLAVAWSFASAADLRGRVMRTDPYQGWTPAAGVQITLQNSSGRTVQQPVVSGNEGFYYIYNVAPGSYRLTYVYQRRANSAAAHGTMQVLVGNGKNQDIALIKIPN